MFSSTKAKISPLISIIKKALTPPARRAAWQWAEENRIIEGSERGRFRASRTPYVKAISDAVLSPHFDFVVGVMGSQMGKTEALFNEVGRNFDDTPSPLLWVTPNRKLAESMSKDRLKKMLRSTPSLWAGLAKGKQETITEKYINGARLGFGWAGSATELASHPARLVLLDERDRMGGDSGGEGDPTSIVKARTSTYPDGCVFSVSTPTVGTISVIEKNGLFFWSKPEKNEVHSPIWLDFARGTQHHWAWRCPHCADWFIPRTDLLNIADDCTIAHALEHAALGCPNCGGLIEDKHKRRMNDHGFFVAPDQKIVETDEAAGGVWLRQPISAPFGYEARADGAYFVPWHGFLPWSGIKTASFWVSGFCSPWCGFGERAAEIVAARIEGSPKKEQAAINTGCGELYSFSGEAPPWQLVKDKQGNYAEGEIPKNCQFLTVGCDVQGDCIYGVIRGWGYNRESFLIEAFQLIGPTDQEEVWDNLYAHLASGRGGMPIRRVLIDSSYKPGNKSGSINKVYEFCGSHFPWTLPVKGRKTMDKFYRFSPISDKRVADATGQDLQLCLVNTNHFKTWLHGRIEAEAGAAVGWHVHRDITDNYCQQVTAEAKVVNDRGVITWLAIRKENHFFDCEVYAACAAEIEAVAGLQPLPGQEIKSTQSIEMPPGLQGQVNQKSNQNTGRRRGARGQGVRR